MAGLNDVTIIKEDGLLREAANEDRTTLLICGGVQVEYGDDGVTALNTLHGPFYALEDAEAVGITAAYDTDNDVLIHHHIEQFFRAFGENISKRPAKPLYLWMVSQSTPLSVMCDKDEENSVYQAVIDAELAIRRIGVVLNPTDDYTPDTDDNGFDSDVATAVAKAQATATALYEAHGPVEFFIECRDFSPAIAGDAIDTADLESEDVCLIIAQDLDISGSTDLRNGYAAVGTVLGMACSKPTVADCFAEVGLKLQGNVQDKSEGYFLNYGYGNTPLNEWSLSSQNAFYDKHYVGLRIHPNTSGVYFTNSFTCAAATSDFIFTELNAVHNKAYRGIHKAYVPYLNTKIKLTSAGYLPGDVVKDLEKVGNAVFATMANAGEISDGKTYIDPKQAIAITRKLVVKWKMVQQGKIEDMEGSLSYTVALA